MIVLGVTHPISHNSAACVLVDGALVAFAEEERFLRLKHAPNFFPERAVDFCLRQAGVSPADVDATAIGFSPPAQGAPSAEQIRGYLDGTLAPQDVFRFHCDASHLASNLKLQTYGRRMYFDHHLCHAASAFDPSSFSEANVISLDGWGGALSGLLGYQRRGEPLKVLVEIAPEQSWGMLYEMVTQALGFRAHSGEGKTMGLAPYGRVDESLLPDWCEPTLGLPDLGRYRAFVRKIAPRRSNEPLTENHKNLAATLQHYYTRSLVRIARELKSRTGSGKFVLAGGVALNCTGNGALASQEFVDDIFVQPASHDGGTALGAAVLAHRELSGRDASVRMEHAYWGYEITADAALAALEFAGVPFRECDPAEEAASALEQDRVVAWAQGRAEIGPRALGARSILANPARVENLARVNHVKRREGWRPLAPSVLAEQYEDLFGKAIPSPFMLLAGNMRGEWAKRLPAVVHVDGSSRPQYVTSAASPLYHRMLESFRARTGSPAVLNTSFNLDDEPVANSPGNALATFFRSPIEVLIVGNFVVEKPSR